MIDIMKRFFIFMLLAAAANQASAQGNYYEGQRIYIDSNFTLKCSSADSDAFSLTNSKDSIYYTLSGTPSGIGPQQEMSINESNCKFASSNEAMLNAFYESFTTAQLEAMAGQLLPMVVLFDALGNIVHMSIIITNTPQNKAIPPQTYANFYKKFKSYVKFRIVDTRLNYNTIFLFVEMDRVRRRGIVFSN